MERGTKGVRSKTRPRPLPDAADSKVVDLQAVENSAIGERHSPGVIGII